MNLIWDFYRQVASADGLGGSVHYFDTNAQIIYLDDGSIMSKASVVEQGHWSEVPLGTAVQIGDFNYTVLSLDHSHNGTLYGVVTDGTSLYFLRYVYAMDISDIYESGSWQEQIDNQVAQLSLNLKNISPETFNAENTLFNPGAKLAVKFTAGDSDPYDIGVVYLDDIDYDAYASTIPISGRNSIGYFLSEQTFDDRNIYSGGRSTVFAAILTDAGITLCHVQEDEMAVSLTFDSNKAILEGLNTSLSEIGWRMVELPDGYIVIGNEAYIGGYIANGHYSFNGGTEAFKRRTSKNADAAYTRVCVTNSEGVAVYRNVPYWEHWKLGARKTKYYDAPEGYTDSQMESYAERLAAELQYVGIGEAFTSPIRPHLLVGDIADVYYTGDTESTSLGIITQITHQFGQSGFFTDFSLDSGGTATDGDDYTVVSTAALNGYNRKQRVIDIVGLVAEKKATRVYSGGGTATVSRSMVEAAAIAPASLLKIL